MEMIITISAIPNIYDKDKVDSWVICDFDLETAQDERLKELGRMPYEKAHQRHMQYLADLRKQGVNVQKETCGRAGCSDCADDHQHSWKYRAKTGEERAVCLFSCR